MKKLTEEWKVKKRKTGNRSFKELIDFNFSNAEDREKTPVRKGAFKPKSIIDATNFSKLQDAAQNENGFGTLRRSIRLHNKTIEKREEKSDMPIEKNEKSSSGASIINIVDENCVNEGKGIMEKVYSLSQWGLPLSIVEAYKSRNISKMFQWQYECLCMKDVLDGRNLVFSAPTSAGKTLVAEILMLKNVIETGKKAIMILPFVSVVREKVHYFQEMFQNAGIIVDGYMGAHNPAGGFKAVDVAICTIEKANNLINRLMEEKRLNELGILVVDELHMLGDHSRGYLLELLLTKLLYNCKQNNVTVQIIGMSATLPNLKVLSTWLDAELYCTDFRPVPLLETFKIGPVVYDARTKEPIRDLRKNSATFSDDVDHITYLSIETITAGHGVLIFCPSKNWCENLATTIAKEIYTIGKPNAISNGNVEYKIIGEKLREHLNGSQLNDVILQLKNSPSGLDSVLGLTVPFGVAFHHAGLTFDERDIVEGAFRQGIIKILVATSTLSSGVNLPARRVIIRSPLFCGAVIDVLSYKQMVGRAGRKGIDDKGESILLCKESEKNAALTLVNSNLPPVKSCLLKSGSSSVHSSLKRALIEVIASGVASSQKEVQHYISYIIFKNQETVDDSIEISYKPTRLGLAILASGFSPDDALRILKELQLARRCFVLENDLHILYEVTPPYLSDQMGALNWMHFLSLWEELPEEFKRVGELVGVQENFIGLGIQGKLSKNSHKFFHKLAVHQRFYSALALNDLIQEVSLSAVAERYGCTRGILQSLQQTTSTFAGMLTIFCNRLGWYNLELLFSSFQKRVHFGIQQELCDLLDELALVLCNMGSFESAKQFEGDLAKEILERSKAKRIRITGKKGVNEKEAAHLIIEEARNFIKQELGISKISWKHLATKKFKGDFDSNNSDDENASKCSQKESVNHLISVPLDQDNYPKIVREMFAEETSNSHEDRTCATQNAVKIVKASSESNNDDGMMNSSVHDSASQNANIDLTKNIICLSNDSVLHSLENHVESEEMSEISKSNNTEFHPKGTLKCVNPCRALSETASEKENLCTHSKNEPLLFDAAKIDLQKENMSNHAKVSNEKFDSLDMLDDVHFSELLLSQTAETENVYFAESFISDLGTANINVSGRFDTKNNEMSMKNGSSSPSFSKNKISDEECLQGLLNESNIFKSDCTFSLYLHNLSGVKEGNKKNVSMNVNQMKQSIQKQLSNDKILNDHEILKNSELNAHNHSTPINHQKIKRNNSHYKKELSIDETSGDIFYSDGSFNQDCLEAKSNKDLDSGNLQCKEDNIRLETETSGDIFDDDSFSDVKEMHISPSVNPAMQKQNVKLKEPVSVLLESGAISNAFLFNGNNSSEVNNYSDTKIQTWALNCKILEETCEENSVSESVKEIYKNKEHGLSAENNKTWKIEEESNFWKPWDPSNNSLNLSNKSQNSETLSKNIVNNKENVNRCKSEAGQSESAEDKLIGSVDNTDQRSISVDDLDSADNSLFDSFTSDVLPPTPTPDIAVKTCISLHKAANDSESQSFHATNFQKSKKDDILADDKGVPKLFSAQDKITFKTLDVPDAELAAFFKRIAKMKRISFSVACERTSFNHKSIGPPRSAKNSMIKNDKCIVDQEKAVVGLAVCYGEDAFYITISDQLSADKAFTYLPFSEKMKLIQEFFCNLLQCETLVAYDMKSQYKMLWQGCGISLKQNCVDPSVAAWLLDPALGQPSLKLLSHSFCPEAVPLLQNFDNYQGSLGMQYFSSTPGKQRASTEAFVVFHLIDRLLVTLKDQELYKAFTDIEMPSIIAFAKMEQNGLGFNTILAVKYQKELQKKQQDILEKAYEMAGRRFNILSSKEVSRILYKELKLNPGITPGSPSTRRLLSVGTPNHNRRLPPELKTNKECLEKILHLHPLPKAILDWRRLSFATTKALLPLLRKNRKDSFFDMDRLYATSYVYTLTGRVNVHSPNLQFIPRDFSVDCTLQDDDEDQCTHEVMSQFGVSLRNLFIPSTGNVLLSVDYSQLELRILAHLSGDKKLIKSLNSGTDVFKTIAANWKNIPVESVSSELRQQTKKICYGMIYGISVHTLSQQLNTTEENASKFMETFKNSYPSLTAYFQSVIDGCSTHGYVSTLMHRRRYLPLIKSKKRSERAQAERQAINTTIQGSAADLIKAAMIKIENDLLAAFPETSTPYSSIQNPGIRGSHLKRLCRGGFLVLQMHDELIYEVNRNDLKEVLKIVKNAMEKTTKLSVKLPVKIRTGTSWGEMVEMS
ncbi:DNA polymerase theta like protein [Argiope bruennichi]|uniref:DNA polymerase theta like protein n=1 Tax=Argiope bruennichi TaxID=94029 RepID=A0A8T0EGS1_ARGBR|nr:DNA polymerase theta like protein [Argiope bruennichi]